MEKEIVDAKNRIGYIDGMRGIACVLVILCHLACVFIPSLYFEGRATTSFERIWLNSPLNIITNGNAAVQCFFVLSGYLIARKVYFGKRIRKNPLSCYYKLIRVVAPGVLLAALLMTAGLMFHIKAAENNSLLSFVNEYNNFSPTIKSVFSDIFYRSFFDGSVYVGPFWTIKFEFLGSMLIIALSYYAVDNKYSKLYYLLLGFALFFVNINIVSFIIGAFACDCLEKDDDTLIGKMIKNVISNKLALLFLFLIGLYLLSVNGSIKGVYKPIQLIPIVRNYPELIRAIGVSLIIIAINKKTYLQRIVSVCALRWLGKTSAYIYAFHWPITLSVGCGVYLLLSKYLDYYTVVLIASVSVFAVTFLLAHLYTIILLPKITLVEKKIIDRFKNKV